MKCTMAEVGVSVTAAELVSFLDDQRRGGFAFIKGYCSTETGEVADIWIKASCRYDLMVSRSVKALDDGSLMGHIIEHGLEVRRGTWVDDKGIQYNRKAIGRVYQRIEKTYSMAEINDAAMILEAMSAVRKGLVEPKKVDQGFTGVAKGAFTKDGEAPGVLYIRDAMIVHKTVTQQGEQKQTASDEFPAVKEAIRQMLPVGKYRSFKLASNFSHVSIGGQAILQGANLGAWDMSLALTEMVKEPVAVPAAGMDGDKWNQEA